MNDPDVEDFDRNLFVFQLTFEIKANIFPKDYFYLEKSILWYPELQTASQNKENLR